MVPFQLGEMPSRLPERYAGTQAPAAFRVQTFNDALFTKLTSARSPAVCHVDANVSRGSSRAGD
jgi:hypothetical protein